MTAEVERVLAQCKALGIILEPTPDGEHLDLHYQAPPPEELRQMLRQHKAEILSLLKPQTPLWHAQRIAEAVQKEGVCLFWSETFGELVAFIREESFRSMVPCGIIVYTLAEIEELWGEGKPKTPPETLRLIHETKKHGGKVAEYGSKDVREC